MRRFTAIVLAAVLMLVPMFSTAAEDNGHFEIYYNQSDVASSTVEYGVDESYVVSIPTQIDMTLTGTTNVTVGANNVYLPRAKTLTVDLSSAAHNGSWQLTLEVFTDSKVAYSIKLGETEVQNGGEILACSGGTPTAETELAFSITGDPKRSGNYMDTLTFTVSIDEN